MRPAAGVWPFSVLGGPPPAGWRPPTRARPLDLVRTWGAASRFAALLARGAFSQRLGRGGWPANTTEAGLHEIRLASLRTLQLLRVELDVVGADLVPTAGGLVFMWNQTSHLDHVILPVAIPRPFHSLFNNEIKRTPLYGDYLARSGHFWVDRTDEAQWRVQVAGVAARVRDGACVLVSPEGTRSWDGRLLPMKRGAFLLARTAGAPIVCVTVVGAHQRLPRGTMAVRPGRARVVFSPPIPASPDAPDLEATVTACFERALAAHGGDV